MLKIMKKNQGMSPAMLINEVGGVISVQLNVCYHSPEMQRGEGWCNGKSVHLTPLWPGSIPRPGVRCGSSLLLALVLALKVFLLIGLPVALSSHPPPFPSPLPSISPFHPPPFPSPINTHFQAGLYGVILFSHQVD